jgi:hypothetical protein
MPAFRASLVVAALATSLLCGCSVSDGPGSFYIDPGRYSVAHCDELARRSKELAEREKLLRNLMEKANEGGGGGAIVGVVAYRSDYETALAEQKQVRRAAAERKCEIAQPYQSDQSIR